MNTTNQSLPSQSPLDNDRILQALQAARLKLEAADRAKDEPIAIIGMSGRFPGAENIAEFWENLKAGKSGIRSLTDDELNASGIPPEIWQQPNYVRAYASPNQIAGFDAGLFGYSPRETELIDPQHRLFLECAWEALEHAGYDPDQTADKIAVYGGASMNSYLINLHSQPHLRDTIDPVEVVVGNALGLMPMRVAHKLNLKGAACGVQTGCSTSLVAVHLACQNLRLRECDMALAGGASVGILQKQGYVYQPDGILSPDGACRAFDAAAEGTVFGNGVGIVVLKRLSDAIAAGDQIYATIRATAINNDGAQKVGLTAPSVSGQAEVIAAALEKAKVLPQSIGYLETHGTGTTMGDPIEIAALHQAYGTSEQPYCAIGSVKTNVGHLDAAAGITGLIKTALILHHGQIPASLNFQTINPKIDLTHSPFYINTQLQDWPEPDPTKPRRVALSSFGMGGTNAHAILEAAPQRPESPPSRPSQLLTLSAKTPTALAILNQDLVTYLKQTPEANLADIAYTLKCGRKPLEHRQVNVCSTIEEAIAALESSVQPSTPTHLPIAFLFSGQGSQYIQMGRELYETEPVFRSWLDQGFELLQSQANLDLKSLLYDRPDATSLNQTQNSQPAIFLIEYAMAQMLIEWGIQPQAMLGHSIGEYVAATLAGVFSFELALKLVSLRGQLMQACEPGVMLSVSCPSEQIIPLLIADTYLSVINAPNLSVVSGRSTAIAELETILTEKAITHRQLHTSHAFHSPMMQPAATKLLQHLQTLTLNPPQQLWIANLTGTWITPDQAIDPQYWHDHLLNPVQFAEGLACLQQTPHLLLEVGAGQTLCTIARQNQLISNNPASPIIATIRHPQDTQSDTAHLLKALGQLWLNGTAINWTAFYATEQRRRLALPTYPFERQSYWIELQSNDYTSRPDPIKSADLSDYFYLPTWQRSPLIFAPETTDLTPEIWTIYSADPAMAQQWRQQLAHQDIPSTVIASADFAQLDTTTHLLYIVSEHDANLHHLLALSQKLATRSSLINLKLITCEAQAIIGNETLDMAQSMVYGFCRVMTQEHSHIHCQIIDLDYAIYSNPASSADLVQEIFQSTPNHYGKSAYRHGQRWRPDYQPIHLPDLPHPKIQIKSNQTYIIAGDLTEGLGQLYADWLGRDCGAKLLLLGPSHLPAMPNWETWLATHGAQDPTSQWIRTTQALQTNGVSLQFTPIDFNDGTALQTYIQNHPAPISGVIYAGAMGDRHSCLIRDLTPEILDHQLHQKLRSLQNLESALQDQPLDFFLLQSSLSTIVGGLGFAAYAAGHCALNTLSDRQQSAKTPWISLNWDAVQFVPEATTQVQWLTASIAATDIKHLTQKVFAQGISSSIIVSPILLSDRLKKAQISTTELIAQHNRPTLSTTYIAPRNSTEQRVAVLMEQLLGLTEIGIDDNFFELGGHSLLAIQAVSQLRTEFQVDIPMRQFLFESPTVSGIARLIDQLQGNDTPKNITEDALDEAENLLAQIEKIP